MKTFKQGSDIMQLRFEKKKSLLLHGLMEGNGEREKMKRQLKRLMQKSK